jgi:hypothetical protein
MCRKVFLSAFVVNRKKIIDTILLLLHLLFVDDGQTERWP